MIKSIKIENFQSHQETELFFSKGVNVIIGLSDSGKSSIIRALKWVIFNRPLGDFFRSYWEGETKVELITVDDSKIERIKNNTENQYKINDLDLKAIGTEVPQEVSTIINIPLSNFQSQIESPFLFTLSPGEVASHINQITNLDLIDVGFKNLKTAIKDIKNRMDITQEKINELKEEKEKIGDLKIIEKSLVSLEKLTQKNINLKNKSKGLINIIDKLASAQDKTKEYINIDKFKDKYVFLEKSLDTLKTLQDKVKGLVHIIIENRQQEKIKKENLNIVEHSKNLQKINENYEQYKTLIIQIRVLGDSIKVLENLFTKSENLTRQINKNEKEYEKILPEICPLCGSKIK